jgi:mono/diheme cytochrome c family protein/plastocyanin
MQAAAEQQQVTDVERGYNIYQANCAQCHGVQGEGGKGPVLNRQDKLFAHLNPDYLRNMLQVGGRYACGTPTSIMPVWSNTGNPPGPLNYKQINDIIAFLRSSKADTYRVLDPSLFEPVIDKTTGKVKTFTGWVDPNYQPAAGATPYPACWQTEFTGGGSAATPAPSGAAPSAGASGAPASQAPSGATVNETALNVAFGTGALTAPAGADFTLNFDNQDAGIPHNIVIKDASGGTVFTGDLVTGPKQIAYGVKALAAGDYTFVCAVHPNMTGTLKVGS